MSYEVPGMTEKQVLAAIEQAVNSLASTYKFGYHDIEDIKQEGRLLALKLIKSGSYDNKRPLGNFLFTHIRNRLSNFKRDNFRRNDPPCITCHRAFQEAHCSECSHVNDGKYCKKYVTWRKRNDSKQNLMNMLDLSVLDGDSDFLAYTNSDVVERSELSEIQDILDQYLTAEQRKLLLKLRAGESVSSIKRKELEQYIFDILKRYGIICPTNSNVDS